MIRLTDAFILARTKLRTHRVRTGLTVGISGILFGLLLAAVFIAQGVFDSFDKFSDEGLNGRYVVVLSKFPSNDYLVYEHLEDQALIKRIETAHAALIAKKKAAAQKYNVEYNPEIEDPSPVITESTTKMKRLDEQKIYESTVVFEVVAEIDAQTHKPFNPKEYLKSYKTATVLAKNQELSTLDGSSGIAYMKDGKENLTSNQKPANMASVSDVNSGISLLPQTLAEPFVTNTGFNPSKGEIPAIIPYPTAEKLLKLQPLEKTATNAEKLARIQEVRRRVGDITASLCYRNQASQTFLTRAITTNKEITANKNNPDFVKPSVVYNIPKDTDCGAVTVQSDTRTAAEKLADENHKKYEKEIGTYIGEPMQHKITMRGVGVSAGYSATGVGTSSIADVLQIVLGASLGEATWVVPSGLLEKVPAASRPAEIFNPQKPAEGSRESYGDESYYVEFTDKNEARTLLSRSGAALFSAGTGDNVTAMQFGSGSLILDEIRLFFETILLWTVLVVSVVAVIILGGVIGRTISDSRRESAVFRAIGARRIDITTIYVTYTFLLSLRIVLFAVVSGLVVATIIDLLTYKDATVGAQLTLGGLHPEKEFHFIGLASWYVLAILAVIMAVGFLAMIIPLLRNVRRNPINDMRDE